VCGPGYYTAVSSTTGVQSCEPCFPGQFKSSAGDTSANAQCDYCATGKVSEPAATECYICAAGYEARAVVLPDGVTSVWKCSACDVGFFRSAQEATMPDGSPTIPSSCSACAAGFIADREGYDRCSLCEGGMEASEDGTRCVHCKAGKYRAPEGSFGLTGVFATAGGISRKNTTGAAVLKRAKEEDAAVTAPTVCAACVAGFMTDRIKAHRCSLCEGGTEASKDSTGCETCTAGKYRAPEGSWGTGGVFFGGRKNTTSNDLIRAKNEDELVTEPTSCASCDAGYVSRDAGASKCTACTSGKVSGNELGAVECLTCKTVPDTLYAAAAQAKCTGCVSPLEIKIGSSSDNINDCVCSEGKYLSAGSVGVSPVCTNCPDGGFCPQGTMNVTDILGKPGYWRPSKDVPQFWSCPVSTQTKDGKFWRNWMTCYGGKQSQCAPVFAWREGSIGHVQEPGGGDLDTGSVQAALMKAMMPIEVTDP
jgi:predicted Zn-ribbon and HTH transcriptional regulator